MKIWMLGSGSEGNAVLCECEDERILIDCGFGTRTIKWRMQAAGLEPESIAACFVTHEHADHIGGVIGASKRWAWPLFASAGTATAGELGDTPVTLVASGQTVALQRMTVEVVATPHDASESLGFVITSNTSGSRAAVFSDIGHVSPAIRKACADVNVLVIESNHDEEMLRWGPYPYSVQQRIRGQRGHLSNRDAANLIGESVHSGLQHVVLAHISGQCNTPRVALDAASPILRRTRFKGRLTAAPQHMVVGPFVPTAGAPKQLDLF